MTYCTFRVGTVLVLSLPTRHVSDCITVIGDHQYNTLGNVLLAMGISLMSGMRVRRQTNLAWDGRRRLQIQHCERICQL
jgi:hypothetical protein